MIVFKFSSIEANKNFVDGCFIGFSLKNGDRMEENRS